MSFHGYYFSYTASKWLMSVATCLNLCVSELNVFSTSMMFEGEILRVISLNCLPLYGMKAYISANGLFAPVPDALLFCYYVILLGLRATLIVMDYILVTFFFGPILHLLSSTLCSAISPLICSPLCFKVIIPH